MSQSFDVVIIGGGIVGGAVATFLAQHPDFKGSIAMVERDKTYEKASAPRSMGGIRQQFTTPENIRISQFAAEFLANIAEFLSVDGEVPDVNFRENGYLFLASEATEASMRRIHEIQINEGAKVELLDPDSLVKRFPLINPDGLALASFGLADEGFIDAFSLLQGFRKKARAAGVVMIDAEVSDITTKGGQVESVSLSSGEKIGCGIAVNCAGYSAGNVASWAGISLPVKPRKRYVYVLDARHEIKDFPLMIDNTGIFLRPEGAYFLCGLSPNDDEDEDVDPDDFEVDHSWFEERIWEALAHRAPVFEAIKVVNSWAGHYDMNLFDHNAIIGAHRACPNLYHATGFSGHGVQQAPAVGRGMAELIATGGFETLDLSVFRPERIEENDPHIEEAVV